MVNDHPRRAFGQRVIDRKHCLDHPDLKQCFSGLRVGIYNGSNTVSGIDSASPC